MNSVYDDENLQAAADAEAAHAKKLQVLLLLPPPPPPPPPLLLLLVTHYSGRSCSSS
jgi:hypothetical protein